MTSWKGLTLAILALLSIDARIILAQYVTTVTISINDNPFCTPVTGIEGSGGSAGSMSGFGASGTNGAGVGVSTLTSGSGSSHRSSSGKTSVANGSVPVLSIDTASGRWVALGYYTVPKAGNLLDGPTSTSPVMTVAICGTDCQGYTFLALANGNECNCGSFPPSSVSSSPSQSKDKRPAIRNDCTTCAGDAAECCGAPGDYALLYQFMPYIESSSAAINTWIHLAGSGVETLSTNFSPISWASIIAYTPSGSNGVVAVGSTISYGAPLALTSTYVQSSTASITSVKAATSTNLTPLAATPTVSGTVLGSGGGPSPSTSFSSSYTGFDYGSGSTGLVSGLPIPSSASYSITNLLSTAAVSSTRSQGSALQSSSIATATTAGIAPAAHGGSGNIVGFGGGSTTTNSGSTATIDGGAAEPTVASPTPSCVKAADYAGNNTKYIDYFGYTYDIRCNLDLQSTPTDYDAYAENFEDCLEYCSLLKDCIAVTYQDPHSSLTEVSNCYPKWTFGGYKTSAADGTYSGVNVDGPSLGALENQDLCTSDNIQGASYAGTTYYDDFGTAWIITCGTQIAISSSAALSSTVTDTLASCIDYCSTYNSCTVVSWTGSHTRGTLNAPNCFPGSLAGKAGAVGSAPGSAYAVLNDL